MKVHLADNSNFKSNYFRFYQKNGEGTVNEISTDNAENLGKEPVLITDKETIAMDYDGKRYTAKSKYPIAEYKIYYKDTNKYENNGKSIYIDSHKLSRDVFVKDLINRGKPLQKDIAKGFGEGRLIDNIKNIPKDESVILLLKDVGEGYELAQLPVNVKGIVVSDGIINFLSHIASLARSYYNMLTILYDKDKYNKLAQLKNKYISISNTDGNLTFKEIEKTPYAVEQQLINIPMLIGEDGFLNYSQLTKKNSSTKAYRLGMMQTLKYDGVLKNIEIPRGFIIPAKYIEKVENFLDEAVNDKERTDRKFENPYIKELEYKCESLGIDPKKIMMRSAFNAEDLYEYPTAGLYESDRCYRSDDFIFTMDNIYKSKDSPQAIESRKRYNIPDNVIQPSIIVQEYMAPEYTFTAYTDFDNKTVNIELSPKRYELIHINPAQIIYNENNEKSEIVEHQIYNSQFITDEKGNILEKEDGLNLVEDNWEVLAPLITIIGKNALALEKVFSKRQDVEGGIKNGKVYFWQTRDIVNKALKKL